MRYIRCETTSHEKLIKLYVIAPNSNVIKASYPSVEQKVKRKGSSQ